MATHVLTVRGGTVGGTVVTSTPQVWTLVMGGGELRLIRFVCKDRQGDTISQSQLKCLRGFQMQHEQEHSMIGVGG